MAGGPTEAWPRDRPLRLATRGSPLARRQCDMAAHLLAQARPGLLVETVVVRTEGDRRQDESIEHIGGQGAFVKEVQQALLEGRADVAVHSAKDLPPETPGLLRLGAVPRRGDPRDALVGASLHRLSPGARVATGAPRRRVQLANLRPDLCFVPVRGNIETRLGVVGRGEAEAVVVAAAALERLHATARAAEILSPLAVLPQVGQGAIALECRRDDAPVEELLGRVDDGPTHRAVAAERAMLASLGASCTLPVAGWATVAGEEVSLSAMVASADGRVLLHARSRGRDPGAVGREAASVLMDRCGGAELLGLGGEPNR